MAIVYSQFFNPLFFCVDNTGKPLQGGGVFFYESSDHSKKKAIYKVPPSQDNPDGIPWPNPIELNAGAFQPDNYGIWGADDAPYYIEIRASTDPTSELIFSEDDFSPPGGGGGGGGGGTAAKNFIINGQFFYNYGEVIEGIDVVGYKNLPASDILVAPGNWHFIKNNTTSVDDELLFPVFAPGQTDVPSNPYAGIQYIATDPGSGETVKQINYLFDSVYFLSGTTVSIQFYAISSSSSSINVNFIQNFGTGGSTTVNTSLQTIALTPDWTQYQLTVEIPNINGKAVGSGNYSALSIELPHNAICNAIFTNFFVEISATPSTYEPASPNITRAQTIGQQYPIVSPDVINWSDGNYEPIVVKGNSYLSFIPLAGRIFMWGSEAPPTYALLCNHMPYYSADYYNLAQDSYDATQSKLKYGNAPNAFTNTISTNTITSTCVLNGEVNPPQDINSGYTVIQTVPGNSSTQAVFTCECLTGAATINGSYFICYSPNKGYYVYFSKNNQAADPTPISPSNLKAVKVIYTGTETNAQMAALVAQQLLVAQFYVPDYRGLFVRGWSDGITAVLEQPAKVTITSAGNDSGMNFTISGLDINNAPITEVLTGANAGTSTSTNIYTAIVSITPSANTASTITAGDAGFATGLCLSQTGTATTALILNGIFSRDPDRLTRTALFNGGPAADNTGSYQQNKNLSHNHPGSEGGRLVISDHNGGKSVGGGSDTYLDAPQFSGGNQSNPNNVYTNFIICF